MNPKEIVVRNFKIDPKDIVYIKAVVESYEGMAIIRTIEAGQPIIEVLIAHDFTAIIHQVLQELQSQVLLEEILNPIEESLIP